jgi:hypothetical protein
MALTIERYQLDDFRVIAGINPESLKRAVDRLRQLDPAPIRVDKLADMLADDLGDNQTAGAVLREAILVYGSIRQSGLNVGEVQERLREALSADPEWSEASGVNWRAVDAQFCEFLSLPIVRLAASALDLSSEHAHLWRGARILTDIRPIFNADATDIDGAVVSHTFRLRLETSSTRQELSVAMDESDIRELARQCERALRKAQTARDLMNDRAQIPTMIAGKRDDD